MYTQEIRQNRQRSLSQTCKAVDRQPARYFDQVPRGLDEVDKNYVGKPQYLPEYAQDIFEYLQQQENKIRVSSAFLVNQMEINNRTRAILIDWLVNLHSHFRLLPETLFITVNIIDRYLDKRPLIKSNLQLLGVTALMVASKYEDIYPPEISEFIKSTENSYTKDQIKRMEVEILNTLSFQLTFPTPWRFCERFALLTGLDRRGMCLARYILELSLLEADMLKFKNSLIATCAVVLGQRVFHKNWAWNKRMEKLTGYRESELQDCLKDLLILLVTADNHPLKCVREKYSRNTLCEVAKINFKELQQLL